MARPRRNDGKIHLHLHKDKECLYAVSRDPVPKGYSPAKAKGFDSGTGKKRRGRPLKRQYTDDRN